MTNRHTARAIALALFAASLGACATHRPDPEAIVDNDTPDAATLPAEFHRAPIGHDHLRGALPSQ